MTYFDLGRDISQSLSPYLEQNSLIIETMKIKEDEVYTVLKFTYSDGSFKIRNLIAFDRLLEDLKNKVVYLSFGYMGEVETSRFLSLNSNGQLLITNKIKDARTDIQTDTDYITLSTLHSEKLRAHLLDLYTQISKKMGNDEYVRLYKALLGIK